MSACTRCGRPLSFNDIGACKKFISRDGSLFLCRDCLAEAMGIPRALIDQKIEQLKRQGCTLFV